MPSGICCRKLLTLRLPPVRSMEAAVAAALDAAAEDAADVRMALVAEHDARHAYELACVTRSLEVRVEMWRVPFRMR